MENIIELEKIKNGIENFLEENKLNVFAVHDELLTSTELGELQGIQAKGNAKGRKMNELLYKMGFLEENPDKEKDNKKWKLTEKGRKYAITPVKFVVSLVNENNNILIDLKKDNHKWLSAVKKEIEKNKEEIKDETK